jgi:hypothetical protein
MKYLPLIVVLPLILPIYGQEKSSKPPTNQQSLQQRSTQVSPSTGNAVDQEATNKKSDGAKDDPKSYLSRLFSPENLPNLGLLVAGVIGIIVALCTLGVLRDQTIATQQSVAMFVSKERAKLIAEPLISERNFLEGTESFPWYSILILVVHYGPTHAFNVRAFGSMVIKDSVEKKDWPKVDEGDIFIDRVIESGSKPSTYEIILSCDPATISEINSGKQFIHLCGKVTYDDIFEKSHVTPFRYFWEVDGFRAAPEAPWVDTSRWTKLGVEDNRVI